jgi:predicted metalloprotease with PDZ domain
MIQYRIKPLLPQAHLLEVCVTIDEPEPAGQRLYLPAWIRGSYMVRDFARNVVELSATCRGEVVEVSKEDKQTWRVSPTSGPLVINYSIYAWDLSVRAAHVDTTHAYFNGPSVFIGVEGREAEPCSVEFQRPDSEDFASWRLALAMPSVEIDDAGFGRYQTDDYEALIDYPVEMGTFEVAKFEVERIPHRLVVSGRQNADLQRLCADLEVICREEAALFGELPIEDYLFLLWVVGDGYGGLEHRNSTSLMIGRDDLPVFPMEKMTKGYRRLLSLCSHEYFHLWNVKRITPEVFIQEDTRQEVYTRQLWVFEGITSYYDELILVRSGVIDRTDYFEMLAETVTRVMRGSGRLKQTLAESSFDAWTKFYKQDENAPNAIVSYYAKGALLAMLLDLTIRMKSDGDLSLDDVMRALWQLHGRTQVGLSEDGFESLVEQQTGLDFKGFFDRYVRSSEELPLADALGEFGVELYLLPASSSSDMGGVCVKRPEDAPGRPVLGAKWCQKGESIMLQQVFDHGAAQAAGLSAGDEIVAVGSLRMDAKRMEDQIARIAAGQSLLFHVFRRDELMQFEVTPLPAPADTCWFYLSEPSEAIQCRRRDFWLQGYASRH